MGETSNPLVQQLDLLLLGYGFNFYRAENRLRADDLLIRQRVGAMLGNAAAKLEQVASDFQRRCIPAPSRQQPYPPAELMTRLIDARALRQRLLDRNMLIQGLPAPAQDKIWRRLRDEQTLLANLLQADVNMLEIAASIDRDIANLNAEQWKSPGCETAIATTLDRLDASLAARRQMLQI